MDARADSGGPLRPDLPLPVRSLPHDLCQQSNVSNFIMLSRLVIAFLPRSKRLLISWLQSPPAVILEPRKIKSLTVSTVSPPICHEGTRCHDLHFLNVEL